MNILVYVLVLCLAMAIGVTARMPSTVLGVRLTRAFSEQMAVTEGSALRTAACKAYDASRVERKEGEKQEGEVGNGNGNLHRQASLYVAIHNGNEGKRQLFSDLLETLFQDDPWYREQVDMFPDIAIQTLDALKARWPEEGKVDSIRDLVTIDLDNDTLQSFLKRIVENGLVSEEKKDLYFDLRKSDSKVSVYLARPPLLLAIFDDPTVVEEILYERKRIHGEYTKERKEELSDEFERLFGNGRYLSDDTWLDFRVSGTAP